MARVVLVHGTTAGGWVWKTIAPRLLAAGHAVYTPTLTGLGERSHLLSPLIDLDTHITDVCNVLEFEDLTEVALVGHSYGGMVITGVADRMPERLSKLIYLDALVPHDGEAALDLIPQDQRQEMLQRVATQGMGWLLPVQRGGNNVPTHNLPHPFRSWSEPLHLNNPPAPHIARIYVRFTADKGPNDYFHGAMSISWQRVHEGGWQVYEVKTIHQIIPDPGPKADILLKLL